MTRTADIIDGVSAEDLVAEVLTLFFESPTQLGWDPNIGPLDNFLCGVLKNKMRSHLRRHARHAGSFDDLDLFDNLVGQLTVPPSAPDRDVDETLQALPFQDRYLIRQYYDKGGKRLADQLQIKPNALAARAFRIRRKIRSGKVGKKSENEIREAHILEDCALAFGILGDKAKAIKAVARAQAAVSVTKSTLRDNKRKRYEATETRGSYRPLIGENTIRRLLLLDELKSEQLKNEQADYSKSAGNDYYLRCFIQELAATVLKHTSFYAAVAVTQILCDYSAQKTLEMYALAKNDKALTKDQAAVSRTKEKIMRNLMARFPGRLQLSENKPFRFLSHQPNDEALQYLKYWLRHFLPPMPNPENLHISEPIVGDAGSMQEMVCIYKFFDIAAFDQLASSVAETGFADHLRIPSFVGASTVAGSLEKAIRDISASMNSSAFQMELSIAMRTELLKSRSSL
jgi:DNA-directed RNA polymerase specialized sigma24 family protein